MPNSSVNRQFVNLVAHVPHLLEQQTDKSFKVCSAECNGGGDFITLYNHVILENSQCPLFIFPNDGDGPVICKYNKKQPMNQCQFWILYYPPLKLMCILGGCRKLLKTPIQTQDHRQRTLFIPYMDGSGSQVSIELH